MEVKKLVLENFLSFANLDLDINGVQVIQGENLDQDDQVSNGSGKSVIISGIEYALFATTSRGIPNKELIKWGEKKGYIQLIINCPIRKEELIIERTLGRGGKLELTVNSLPLEFANTNDGNNKIIEWIGISKEDIQNYYIINNIRYESFYTNSNKKKLEMIGRFSNLNILDGSDDVIDDKVKLLNLEIITAGNEINNLYGKIAKCEELIYKEETKDFGKEYENTIINIDDDIAIEQKYIDNCNKIIILGNKNIIDYENNIIASNGLLADVIKDINNVTIPNVDAEVKVINEMIILTGADILNLKKRLKEDEDSYNYLKKEISKSKLNINGSVTCPECKHEFNPAKKGVIISEEILHLEECATILENVDGLIIADNLEIKKNRKIINEAHLRIDNVSLDKNVAIKAISIYEDNLENIKAKIRKLKSLRSSIENSIEETSNKIMFSEERIIEFNKNKKTIKKGSVDLVYIKHLNSDIKLENDNIKKLESIKEKLDDKIYRVAQWKYHFKLFKSDMSMDVLNVITNYTNNVLADFGSELQVRWSGFKVKANGDLSDKITPFIIRDGVEYGFGSFSGGERGRLEYANILANQYLINSTHKYGGLNFLSTDEIAEGIDQLGLQNLIKALNETGKTIMITTHIVNYKDNNVLLVSKQGGSSVII